MEDFTPIGYSLASMNLINQTIVLSTFTWHASLFPLSFPIMPLGDIFQKYLSTSHHSPFLKQLRSHSPSLSCHWGAVYFRYYLFVFASIKIYVSCRKHLADVDVDCFVHETMESYEDTIDTRWRILTRCDPVCWTKTNYSRGKNSCQPMRCQNVSVTWEFGC